MSAPLSTLAITLSAVEENAQHSRHLFPFLSQSDAEIGCRGRFADAALLICDGDDVCVHL